MASNTHGRSTSSRAVPRTTVPSPEEMKEYERLKALAAKMFNEKKYIYAIKHYNDACAAIYSEGDTNSNRLDYYVTCKNNSAQCSINFGDYKGAIKFATLVISKEPQNVKALYRRGISYLNLERPDEALDDLYAAFTIDPRNKETELELMKALMLSMCQSMESMELNQGKISRFLKSIPDIRRKNKQGFNLLMIASMNGLNHIAELLLQNGASINDRSDECGTTSLYIASQGGHIEVVKLLLDHNADINAPSKRGFNSLYIASQNNHFEIVDLLIKRKAKINAKSDNGSTPLMIASKCGHCKIVTLLLSKGLAVNDIDINGSSALHVAIQEGHLEIVELLLSKGADIKHRDMLGNNAIIMACIYNHLDILKILLTKDDYILRKDNLGKTCLQHSKNNDIRTFIQNWDSTLVATMLKELGVLSGIDPSSFLDLRKYIGKM